MIPYGKQNINQADIDAVIEVLKSDFLTQGPKVPAFEQKVLSHCGAKYATATNSATSALHLACVALGVGKGDLVWTSPISFVASSNCALYCGAEVDFVDIDSKTYNMSINALEEKLERAKKANKLPKVVIPVHLAGQSCDMEKILELSHNYGFRIIEDASHAIGGKYKGEPIGNCKYSDITVFSFHPVKIITTGEGGISVTNDEKLNGTMKRLSSHGITRDPGEMTHPPDGLWYYQQIDLGFNYRITDLQAALGISQLKRLNQFVEERHAIAKNYDELFRDLPVLTPFQRSDNYSSYHLYIVRIKLNEWKITHNQIFERLRTAGILVNLHYIPIYRHPYYEQMGFSRQDFPESEAYYSEAISLPMYPGLTYEQQVEIVDRFKTPIGHQTLF
jgi:UDP-4-amino-4,6-dideoxy-N-acetyl-beta-L-altrosamine transaminase